jgi:tellurite resistance protein TehA-like permease
MIKNLSPAYFAMVMATGIVSIAAKTQGFQRLAVFFFSAAAVFYVFLWGLTIARFVRFRSSLSADFTNHAVAPGFFTTAAGTGVLGSSALLVLGWPWLAWALWFLCAGLTFSLVYAVFAALIIKKNKPPIEKGLNGGWLVAVVASQSVSVLGGLLAPHAGAYREWLLFVALDTWLFGGMLYLWIISLIFYRYMFFEFRPEDLAPPYWINMGAVAISTLAGCGLIQAAEDMTLLVRIEPVLLGATLFFWATATWWIPMLLILGYWRHFTERFPLSYNPQYWGAVFPLGMYSVASYRLDDIVDQPIIKTVATLFWWFALLAWSFVIIGLIRSFIPKPLKS